FNASNAVNAQSMQGFLAIRFQSGGGNDSLGRTDESGRNRGFTRIRRMAPNNPYLSVASVEICGSCVSTEHTQHHADLPRRRLRADLSKRGLDLLLFDLVSQQYDGGRVLGHVLLCDAVEADAVFAEGVAQIADYAGRVFGLEPDVIRVDGFPDGKNLADLRADGQLEVAREIWQFQRAGEVDNVSHDGAGGGEAARARTVQHDLADRVALDEDGVVYAFDAGQWMMARRQHRMDAHVQRLIRRRVVLVAG